MGQLGRWALVRQLLQCCPAAGRRATSRCPVPQGPHALQAELRAAVETAVADSSALRYHSGDKLNKSLVTDLQSELS